MKTMILIVALAWSALALWSCGTMGSARESVADDPCASIPESRLPDLIFVNIDYRPHWGPLERPSTHIVAFPEPPDSIEWVGFDATIRNVGPAEFRGSVWLKMSGDTVDMQTGRYPIGGEIKTLRMAPGDSARIGYDRPCSWYQPRTTVRFILISDSNLQHLEEPEKFFGVSPVCEVSRANNIADLTLR